MSKFKIGDYVEIVSVTGLAEDTLIGHKGVIDGVREFSTNSYSLSNEPQYFWREEQLRLVNTKKYLVYNVTSGKSVGIMSKDSGIKYAYSAPQCNIQLYELKYNIVAKPVEYVCQAVELESVTEGN